MTYHARILEALAATAFAAALASGCALETVPPGGPGGGDSPGGVQNPDVNEQDGIECAAALQVTSGTFTESVAPPEGIDPEGCWPVGTWTFTVAVEENQCATDPTLLAEYSYEVTADEELNYTYSFLTDPDDLDVEMKVTSGGSGECEGTFTHYMEDGHGVLTLKPNQHADGTIDGQGDYEKFYKPQI